MLKHKREFLKLRRTVNDRAFDIQTATIVNDFGKYFDEFPDCDVIPVSGSFSTWFTVQHRALKDEDMAVYRRLFKQVEPDVADDMKAVLVGKLLEANMAVQVADIADRWTRGEEINISKLVRAVVEDFEADVKRKVSIPFVEIGDNLFKDAVNNTGISWRLTPLNLAMRRLRIGDFGIIAARPDAGKTSFVAAEITHMASQIAAMFPDEPNRPILWFNNEGPGERIQERVIQAALGLPSSKIVALQKESKLWDTYKAAIGGDLHRIRVLDVHGYKSWQIEEIIKQTNPAIIVFDMIDNIKFDGEVLNGGQRTDQILEGMYQWAREIGVRHKCIVLATSQVSADGDGMAFPTLGMLKDSKTGKQGAADFIITLGKKNEAPYENIRFIGLTKNKLHVEGQKRSPSAEVVFDATAGRFIAGLAPEKPNVRTDNGRGNNDQAELQAQGESVRPGQLGSVDGGQAAEGLSGLQQDQRARVDQGVAGEDALALLT